jgi:hypothetical protein
MNKAPVARVAHVGDDHVHPDQARATVSALPRRLVRHLGPVAGAVVSTHIRTTRNDVKITDWNAETEVVLHPPRQRQVRLMHPNEVLMSNVNASESGRTSCRYQNRQARLPKR